MENIIKDYCDYLVAYGNAVGVKTWIKKFMRKKLNDIRNKLKEKYPFFDEYYKIQCLDDLRNGMYVVFRCGIWGVVERNDNGRFRLVKDNHEIEEKFLAIEFTDTMHHISNQDYDIVEVWQYGECIWREKG